MHFLIMSIAGCAAIVAAGIRCQAAAPVTEVARPDAACTQAVQPGHSPVIVYQDGRLILHTDLPPSAAHATLGKMKRTLRFVEKHWRRRLRGSLECYVAEDASRWPDQAFPHPLARVWIECIGGATVSEQAPASHAGRVKATLYASTRPGAAAHEIVHAYCCQTFGQSGPDWYNEGLATVVGFGGRDGQGVQCPLEVLATLRQESPQTVRQLVQHQPFTSATHDALAQMVAGRGSARGQVPISCWTSADAENLTAMRKAYDRSWSLCYLLLHDPNYQSQFRRLGTTYLTGHRPSYQQTFGAVHQELAFDYRAFMQHVDMGYRVDLCSWEWHKRFRPLEWNGSRSRTIKAARGYQATGVEVVGGQRYHYAAQGNWSMSSDACSTDANGATDGSGRLEAVVMHAYQLSEPFELGTSGRFLAPVSGHLYVRCRDCWNQLADNRGTLKVTFSRVRGD